MQVVFALQVVTQQSLFNQEDLQGLEREERALLDYELALGYVVCLMGVLHIHCTCHVISSIMT